MKYQIIEKEIYSEADCLHFGDNYEMGVIVNEQFPDYTGVPLGDTIFESEDIEEVTERKRQLEINRLKIVGTNPFFDDDELADKFYTSENFTKLKELYKIEFNLELVRINANQMVVKNDDFNFPTEASDEQMMRIQKLVGFYFFEIRQES
jgi:hypothetical protein